METRLEQLKQQLKYQQGKVQYLLNNKNGANSVKLQYHRDKIEYIETKIAELEGVEVK